MCIECDTDASRTMFVCVCVCVSCVPHESRVLVVRESVALQRIASVVRVHSCSQSTHRRLLVGTERRVHPQAREREGTLRGKEAISRRRSDSLINTGNRDSSEGRLTGDDSDAA